MNPRIVLAFAVVGLLMGCAQQPAQTEPTPAGALDRPEPVTGSLLRRDRSKSDVKTVDPSAITSGVRSATGARTATGTP